MRLWTDNVEDYRETEKLQRVLAAGVGQTKVQNVGISRDNRP